ncbi:putative G-protein coupled receptor 174 [Arapaima gigas]
MVAEQNIEWFAHGKCLAAVGWGGLLEWLFAHVSPGEGSRLDVFMSSEGCTCLLVSRVGSHQLPREGKDATPETFGIQDYRRNKQRGSKQCLERCKAGSGQWKMNTTNNSYSCVNGTELKSYQHFIYAVIYTVILVPGLIGNVLALWVFHVYVKETKKAIIFMINLAIADLLQVLSLPLRIYYYLNDSWSFGHLLCMVCFYLKYVNMYASIYFLACISVRRCMLIIHPLRYSSCSRRLDRGLCVAGWVVVFLGCLPFPLLRSAPNSTDCFSELKMVKVSMAAGVTLISAAELLGFLLPLALVLTCSWRTAASLRGKNIVFHDHGEKRKALKMVLSCAAVFLFCFAPYHLTFPFDFLVKSKAMQNCTLHNLILRCHPVTLCLASLNSCLDPIMYYFTTDEFKRRLSRSELPDSFHLHRRLSFATGEEKLQEPHLENGQKTHVATRNDMTEQILVQSGRGA